MATRYTNPIVHVINDDASDVGAGWKLNFYSTGTTTRKNTFSDSELTTSNANPVVADSAGRFSDIFLESGTYKVVLTDADDVEIWTADPVSGGLGSGGGVLAKTSSYTIVADDQSKIITGDSSGGAVTITLLAAATAGDGFEIGVKKIDSSTTAVTVDANGSETIDGAATFVLGAQYHEVLLRCDGTTWHVIADAYADKHTRTQVWAKGADIASATTLVLGTDGNFFDVTGSTGPIGAITVAAGTFFCLQFDSTPTLTHSATLDLPGEANIVAAAGDRAICWAQAANDVQVLSFTRAGQSAETVGVWQHVSTTALTAIANIDTADFVAGYDYNLELENFAPTDDAEGLWMRISDDSGASYEADASDYKYEAIESGTANSSTGDSKIVMSNSASGNDADHVGHYSVYVNNPNNSSLKTLIRWDGGFLNSDATSTLEKIDGIASVESTAVVTNIRFLWSGGSTFKAQGNIVVHRRLRG